jgi:GGDEF domain-containing protein
VLLPQLTQLEDAEQAAKKILAALEVPFLLEGLTLEIGASIGITIYPSDGDDADTLRPTSPCTRRRNTVRVMSCTHARRTITIPLD